jgi:hypothetical protein
MRARPTRIVVITDVPTNIRKAPAFKNDPNAYPVTYATLRYAGGGDSIEMLGGNPFAVGSLTFGTNPVATETIAVNGVTFTFVAGASTATNVHIGATKEETAAEFAAVLGRSANGSITVMSFTVNPSAPAVINISAILPGTAGNAYTLANSSGTVAVTRSGATLSGGLGYGSGQTVDAAADFNDIDQSLTRWAVASGAGGTNLRVTDWEA